MRVVLEDTLETNWPYIAAFVLLGLVIGAAGCRDTTGAGTWRFGGTGAPEDGGRNAESPDVPSAPDTTGRARTADTSSKERSRDSGGDPERRVEARGLFLHMSAGPEKNGHFFRKFSYSSTKPGPGGCRLDLSRASYSSRWWTSGIPKSQLIRAPHRTAKRDEFLAVARITGRLQESSDPSNEDSLPNFDLDDYELLPCATYDAFGGCLTPRRGDQCYRGGLRIPSTGTKHRRERKKYLDVKLVRNIGGVAGTIRYDLTVDYGYGEIADGGAKLQATLRAPTDRRKRYRRWKLSGTATTFKIERGSYFGPVTCVYAGEKIGGWARARQKTDGTRSLELHLVAPELEKTKPDNADAAQICSPPAKIWGEFLIDRTAGMP